jgi:hypothetical protein
MIRAPSTISLFYYNLPGFSRQEGSVEFPQNFRGKRAIVDRTEDDRRKASRTSPPGQRRMIQTKKGIVISAFEWGVGPAAKFKLFYAVFAEKCPKKYFNKVIKKPYFKSLIYIGGGIFSGASNFKAEEFRGVRGLFRVFKFLWGTSTNSFCY